jgi:hypothetical protein
VASALAKGVARSLKGDQTMNKQIEEMCAIMADAVYADCEGTPLVPESAGICGKVSCNRCKEARRLMNAGYRKSTDVAKEIFAELGTSLGISTHHGEVYYLIRAKDYQHYKKKYESEGADDVQH